MKRTFLDKAQTLLKDIWKLLKNPKLLVAGAMLGFSLGDAIAQNQDKPGQDVLVQSDTTYAQDGTRTIEKYYYKHTETQLQPIYEQAPEQQQQQQQQQPVQKESVSDILVAVGYDMNASANTLWSVNGMLYRLQYMNNAWNLCSYGNGRWNPYYSYGGNGGWVDNRAGGVGGWVDNRSGYGYGGGGRGGNVGRGNSNWVDNRSNASATGGSATVNTGDVTQSNNQNVNVYLNGQQIQTATNTNQPTTTQTTTSSQPTWVDNRSGQTPPTPSPSTPSTPSTGIRGGSVDRSATPTTTGVGTTSSPSQTSGTSNQITNPTNAGTTTRQMLQQRLYGSSGSGSQVGGNQNRSYGGGGGGRRR